jgi:type I restriction enzyme S subunit
MINKQIQLHKWQKLRIDEFAEVKSGGTPSTKNEEYWDGGVSWITPKDLSGFGGKYISQGERNISKKGLDNSSAKLLPKNTVLLSSRAPIGYVAIAENELATNQGFKNLICYKEKANFNFVYYLLLYNSNFLKSRGTGATYPELSASKLKEIEFEIPVNVNKQKQIADILSIYDNLIEDNNRRIEILEEMAQAIYKEWFVNFRFPGHENTKFIDSGTEFGKIPEGWEVRELNEILDISKGKSYRSNELTQGEGFPFVNLKCINRGGGFRKDGLKRFIGQYNESQKVKHGDVVVAVTDMTQDRNIIARAARVPFFDSEFGVISMDLVKIIPKKENQINYIYSFLRWSDFPEEVKNYANGANVLHLNPARIKEYKSLIPSVEIQKEFSEKVNSIFELIDRLEYQNEYLFKARDSLLPKLISGKIGIK